MKAEKNSFKSFSRRAICLFGTQLLLMSGLASRMYYLQVVETKRYSMMAEDNRINFRLLAPPRGFIVDRNGDYLAINIQNYRVLLVPEQANSDHSSVNGVLAKLAQLIDLNDNQIRNILKETKKRRAFVPVTIRDNLSWEEISRIAINSPDLPGVDIDVGQSRHYPYGENMAHVLGYVAAVSEKELTGDPLLELPGFRIGKNGIEQRYDLALRGKGGTSKVEVNAFGRIIQEVERIDGKSGHQVMLTVDMQLQDFIGTRINKENAAAVTVMNVHSGDILALVSTPSFNPNSFSEGLTTNEWHGLINNPYSPLTNKSIAGQYAPGSTFKIVVALAALKYGIKPNHSVICNGHITLGDRKFHCWKKRGHGKKDLVGALRESCDIWFYDVAKRIGVDKIAEMAKILGLGKVTGLDIGGEKPGLIPTKKWKRDKLGKPWHKGETLIVGIGQGYVLATPLQLAVMTARVVNGGKSVSPHLTKKYIDGTEIHERVNINEFPSLNIDPAHLAYVIDGMEQVVNSPFGTARRSAIKHPGWEMGGKTGTSQVRSISKAEREEGIRKGDDIAWRLRDHALFIGFAPIDNPKYAVSVIVEHGGGGSKAAAPIARDVLMEIQRLDNELLIRNQENINHVKKG